MTEPERPRPAARRILLVIGGLVLLLCAVFGVTIVRQNAAFRAYREATLEQATLPWTQRAHSPDECVRFAVDWAMACPGLGTWCESEAPRVVGTCLASRDRAGFCAEVGDAVGSTEFGYDACARMREGIAGTYTQRSHKKFCAAGYRAVAEHCRQRGATVTQP